VLCCRVLNMHEVDNAYMWNTSSIVEQTSGLLVLALLHTANLANHALYLAVLELFKTSPSYSVN
jgi:hypothetical protein